QQISWSSASALSAIPMVNAATRMASVKIGRMQRSCQSEQRLSIQRFTPLRHPLSDRGPRSRDTAGPLLPADFSKAEMQRRPAKNLPSFYGEIYPGGIGNRAGDPVQW